MLTVMLEGGRAVPGEIVDESSDAGLARLRQLYAPPPGPWLRLNLVMSLTGSTVGDDGTSDSLSNRSDRRILGVIRRHADAVVVGTATLRAERYRAPRTAALAVVSTSGDLRGHRIDDDDAERVTVYCPESARARVAETAPRGVRTVVSAGDGRVGLGAVLADLRGRGLRSVVCEGGMSIASQLIASDALDEICSTIAPVATTATPPPPPQDVRGGGGSRSMRPELLLLDANGALYGRWRRAAASELANQASIVDSQRTGS